jgi:hypothetical protein
MKIQRLDAVVVGYYTEARTSKVTAWLKKK